MWANQARDGAKGSSFYFNGDTIYSYGPHFPIARHVERKGAHAARLWRVIQRAKAGTPYQANGHTEHAGEFKVDSVDINGTMRAGCHVIEYAELAHLAGLLKLEG